MLMAAGTPGAGKAAKVEGPHSCPILAWLLSGLGSLSCDANQPAWEVRRSGSIHSFTRIHLLSSVLIAGHTTLALKELPVGGR